MVYHYHFKQQTATNEWWIYKHLQNIKYLTWKYKKKYDDQQQAGQRQQANQTH